jgi:cell division septal protein FtsQ
MTNRRSRILQSPKVVEKKRKKLIITSLLILACAILFFVTLFFFFRLPILQVSMIEISGTKTMNTDTIKQKAQEYLEGEYFGLIPRSSTFFFPKFDIKESLINSFKRIERLEIQRKGISGINIVIEEKDAVAIVCGGFHDNDDAEQKCYSVDKNGYVFEESPNFSDGVYPHYYLDLDNKGTNIIGSSFINSDLFQQFQKFIKTIQDSHISIVGLLIGDKDQYELYIKNKDDTEAVVYFDNRIPFEKTASNLILFWNDSMLKKKNATSTPVFDYINLRFGNNIFYVTK